MPDAGITAGPPPVPDLAGLTPWQTQAPDSWRSRLNAAVRALRGPVAEPACLRPRYLHDCEACEFIGAYGPYDIYRCPQGGYPTVICRYGNAGDAYLSGGQLDIEDMTFAVKRWRLGDFPEAVSQSRHFGRAMARVEGHLLANAETRAFIVAEVRNLEASEPTPGLGG